MPPSSHQSKPTELAVQLAGLSRDISYIREKLGALDDARKTQWDVINQIRDEFTLLRGGFRTLQLVGAFLVFTWGATLAYFQISDRYNRSILPMVSAGPSTPGDGQLRK